MVEPPPGFMPEDMSAARELVQQVGERGPFDADDVIAELKGRRERAGGGNGAWLYSKMDAPHQVRRVLGTLEAELFIRRVSNDPPRWQLAQQMTDPN